MPVQFVARPFFCPPTEELRFLPEGPRVLQHNRNKLAWVAIQHGTDSTAGSINFLDLTTLQNITHHLPGRPGFFVETTDPGLLLVGLENELRYFDIREGTLVGPGIPVPMEPRCIINDGLAVAGGVVFGTKHLDFNQPVAELCFFEAATKEVRTLLGGQTCSNGKFLSGTTLIDIDSTPKAITRYQLDTELRQVQSQRPVIAPERLPGFPDGLRPSPDGNSVVVAFYNPEPVADGKALEIRISDGAILTEWIIPGSPRVTCPEFVELDGQIKLLLTTAVEGMPNELRQFAPGAGNIYIADTPYRTLPAVPPLLRI
jgi:sugar lactone lactonase YvrE